MKKNILIKNLHTSYYEVGNIKSPKTLVFLHSFPSNKELFIEHIKILKDRYRIIVPDMPGFGESEPPESYTIKEYAEWLENFLMQLNLYNRDTILYGISFGGIVLLNTKDIDSLGKIILESTPINQYCIHTKEFHYLALLRIFPNILIDWLRRTPVTRELITKIYKSVKPKSAVNLPDSEIRFFITNVNLNTLFSIASLLKRKSTYSRMNLGSNSKAIFIYDSLDPTVKFSSIKRSQFLKGRSLLTTNFNMHAPSTFFTKEVLDLVEL